MSAQYGSVRDYVYYSQRLVGNLLSDSGYVDQAGYSASVSLGVGPVGASLTRSARGAESRHSRCEAADRIVGDQAIWGWDPNESALYLRGRGRGFWAELLPVYKSDEHPAAMFGTRYDYGGRVVNVCLFGSWNNLVGTIPSASPSRQAGGWYSSSNRGLDRLLRFVYSADAETEVDLGSEQDDSDLNLVWNAANIMTIQGLCGDGNRPNAHAPSMRKYTVGEGDVEWLARIYWWQSDVGLFGDVVVGAPLFVRTTTDIPFDWYQDEFDYDSTELLPGRTGLTMPQQFPTHPHALLSDRW